MAVFWGRELSEESVARRKTVELKTSDRSHSEGKWGKTKLDIDSDAERWKVERKCLSEKRKKRR